MSRTLAELEAADVQPPYTVWTCANGRTIALVDMDQRHLENLFGHIERRLRCLRHEPTQLWMGHWVRAVNAELERRRR